MNKILITCSLIAIMLMYGFTAIAQNSKSQDWPQYRGIDRDGISGETELLDKWPESGPELVWKKKIGTGFSEVAIADDKCYTMYGEQEGDSGFEYLMALDAKTGGEIWKTKVDSLFIDAGDWGHGPRGTPTIDKNNVYCFSGFGKLVAYSKKDGKEIWRVDFQKEFGAIMARWGFSDSPLLIDDLLLMETGGTDSRSFTAFDKHTGKVVWSKGERGVYNHNSPIITSIDDKLNIVFITGKTVYGLDLEGNTLWSHELPIGPPTALPVLIEPNKLFISVLSTMSDPAGCVVIEINDGKVTELMQSVNMKNHWSAGCYYKGHIYGFNSSKLNCISVEDGAIQWSQRGLGKGSLMLVDDKLLVLSDKGLLKLVDASSEAYSEKGSVQALEQGRSWTAPSFSDGKVYLRNQTEIACYSLK